MHPTNILLQHYNQMSLDQIESLLQQGANPRSIFNYAIQERNEPLIRLLERYGAEFPEPLGSAPVVCQIERIDCREPGAIDRMDELLELQYEQDEYFSLEPIPEEPCTLGNAQYVDLYFVGTSQQDEQTILCGAGHVVWDTVNNVYFIWTLATQTLKNRAMSKGIGQRLLQAIIDRAIEEDIDLIALEAIPSAHSFYDRFGFLYYPPFGDRYRYRPLNYDVEPIEVPSGDF